MKLYKIIPSLLLCCLCTVALSQVDTIRLNPVVEQKEPYYQPFVFKTCPTSLLFGGIFPYTSEFRITTEPTTGRTQSEQISISYLFPNIFIATIALLSNDKLEASGWRLQYAHKFYLIRKKKFAPYGFYVAPLFSYAEAHVVLGRIAAYNREYLDFRHFNVNAIIGVQIGKFHRLTMDSYFGLGYRKNKVFYHYSSNRVVPYNTIDFGDLYNNHLNAVFGISLGYSL